MQCTQYDHAFAEYENDQVQRFGVVCDAVWKHVLGGEEDVDDELIRRMGAYVEYQLENIVYKLPDDYFDEGRIGWGNVPDLSSFDGDQDQEGHVPVETEADSDSESESESESEKDTNALSGLKHLGQDWMQVLTDAGEPYFWNVETNRTSWQKPE